MHAIISIVRQAQPDDAEACLAVYRPYAPIAGFEDAELYGRGRYAVT
jgi:hypothetical protein